MLYLCKIQNKICDVKVKKVFMKLHISRHFLEETYVPSSCIFCSYFMENHYAQSHVGVACPNNLIIKEDEKKAVLLTRK
jgi:hypothetical protein